MNAMSTSLRIVLGFVAVLICTVSSHPAQAQTRKVGHHPANPSVVRRTRSTAHSLVEPINLSETYKFWTEYDKVVYSESNNALGVINPSGHGLTLIYEYPQAVDQTIAWESEAGSKPNSLLLANGLVLVFRQAATGFYPAGRPSSIRIPQPDNGADAYTESMLREMEEIDRRTRIHNGFPTGNDMSPDSIHGAEVRKNPGYWLTAINSPATPHPMYFRANQITEPTRFDLLHDRSLFKGNEGAKYDRLLEKLAEGNDDVNSPTDHTQEEAALRAFVASSLNNLIHSPDTDLIHHPAFRSIKLPAQTRWLYLSVILPAEKKSGKEQARRDPRYRHFLCMLNRLLLDSLLPEDAVAQPASTDILWHKKVDQSVFSAEVKSGKVVLFDSSHRQIAAFDPVTGP